MSAEWVKDQGKIWNQVKHIPNLAVLLITAPHKTMVSVMAKAFMGTPSDFAWFWAASPFEMGVG